MGCDRTQRPTTSTPLAPLYGMCGAQSLIRCNCGGGGVASEGGKRDLKATPQFDDSPQR